MFTDSHCDWIIEILCRNKSFYIWAVCFALCLYIRIRT